MAHSDISTDELARLAERAQACGDLTEAERHWRDAVARAPTDARLHNGLGTARQLQGDLEGALNAYATALSFSPEFAPALSNSGAALQAPGKYGDALDLYDRAIRQNPHNLGFWRNKLSCLLLVAEAPPESVYEACRRFAANFTPPSDQRLPALSPDVLTRRKGLVRVGFVGSDFYEHSIARNLRPLFEERDGSRVSFGIYSQVARPDGVTQWFKESADWWRDIRSRSDREIAQLVRDDSVDILVLLVGRFDANRPTIAAWRAAPVQVSMFDAATSGFDDMDFWLTDGYLHPVGTTERFSETLFRLPALFCYGAFEVGTPTAGPTPARETGSVTFGCFCNPGKVTGATIVLWAAVLARMSDSTLILKYRALYGDPSTRSRLLTQFAARGIGQERIRFLAEAEGQRTHLERYRAVDIALDTYPFSGATTTYEALSMGVPVISLAGEGFVRRMSASLLAGVGLQLLVCESPPELAERAAALAADLPSLDALRRELPKRVASSALCDGKGYARSVENAFAEMLVMREKTMISS